MKKTLIDFQNFLILDGQLDIEKEEVDRNAEIFAKSINEATDKAFDVRQNEQTQEEFICVSKYEGVTHCLEQCELCKEMYTS